MLDRLRAGLAAAGFRGARRDGRNGAGRARAGAVSRWRRGRAGRRRGSHRAASHRCAQSRSRHDARIPPRGLEDHRAGGLTQTQRTQRPLRRAARLYDRHRAGTRRKPDLAAPSAARLSRRAQFRRTGRHGRGDPLHAHVACGIFGRGAGESAAKAHAVSKPNSIAPMGRCAASRSRPALPSAIPKIVERLFREKLDALIDPLDPGFGFDLIRLCATRAERAEAADADFDADLNAKREIRFPGRSPRRALRIAPHPRLPAERHAHPRMRLRRGARAICARNKNPMGKNPPPERSPAPAAACILESGTNRCSGCRSQWRAVAIPLASRSAQICDCRRP